MPKLQFVTLNLIGRDGKIIPEKRQKPTQSWSSMSVTCDVPGGSFFGIRLSSTPLPFDVVVKVWLDGFFAAGRCFLAGDSQPIIEYDISHIQNSSKLTGSRFRMLDYEDPREYCEVQVTIHRCCIGEKYASDLTSQHDENLNQESLPPSPTSSRGSSFARRGCLNQVEESPIILHEDPNPYLMITWKCRAV
ncbi:uncharacterized protein MELLADRAFT_76283 [Melampsora larici-populina 98AG31]|uniref:Uncharacterized protein n=1 Tax=Melampsora larici-populina (strain 98AG31 / pathotype 3-4-7) TaxID=747676 RepID=F4R3N4_MELLP|nr:uncharacterized protein MELLADRAFT_76283 [Melampsora larici-populina 98AG31]EGG13138.1 hypothetical protein MELLADRAFT_76283 [Melampsora larici-populina 98AG31]